MIEAMDPRELRRSVVIEAVAPTVDGGRYPVKREVGAVVEITADVVKEGHEVLVASVLYRAPGDTAWREQPMRFVDNDRWGGTVSLDTVGRWTFTIEALADPFRSWLADLAKRVDAGQDVASELLEGAALVRAAAARARGADADALAAYASRIGGRAPQAERVAAAREGPLGALMDAWLDRSDATRAEREFTIVADRERARFAAWYEFFPRSTAAGRHGTFKDAEAQLERVAA